MAALEGKGSGNGKNGKHGTGYQKGGYGNGNHNWYRAPGKAIGKGSINYNGVEDDYWNAWAFEGDDWNYNYSHGDGDGYGCYYLGNVMMMFEVGIENAEDETEKKTIEPDMSKYKVSARDALRGTIPLKLVMLHNKFGALQNEDDDESDEDTSDSEQTHRRAQYKAQRKLAKQQLRRWGVHKQQGTIGNCNYNHNHHDHNDTIDDHNYNHTDHGHDHDHSVENDKAS